MVALDWIHSQRENNEALVLNALKLGLKKKEYVDEIRLTRREYYELTNRKKINWENGLSHSRTEYMETLKPSFNVLKCGKTQ